MPGKYLTLKLKYLTGGFDHDEVERRSEEYELHQAFLCRLLCRPVGKLHVFPIRHDGGGTIIFRQRIRSRVLYKLYLSASKLYFRIRMCF